jgi:hypothetical protein
MLYTPHNTGKKNGSVAKLVMPASRVEVHADHPDQSVQRAPLVSLRNLVERAPTVIGIVRSISELRHDAKQFGNERPTPRRIRLRHRPPRPLPKRRPVTGIEAPSAPRGRAIDRGGSSFKERLARSLPLFLAALKRERNADPVRVA